MKISVVQAKDRRLLSIAIVGTLFPFAAFADAGAIDLEPWKALHPNATVPEDHKTDFEVAVPYQLVTKRISDGVRKCYPWGFPLVAVYPDLKQATVSAIQGIGSLAFPASYSIHEVTPNQTRVIAYAIKPTFGSGPTMFVSSAKHLSELSELASLECKAIGF